MKRPLISFVLAAGVSAALVSVQHSARADADLDYRLTEQTRVNEGFRIAPVPLDLSHKSTELVGLGSYLVNAVGGCNDCHTNPSYAPGHDPFLGQPKQVYVAGYLAGGQNFGPFISRNLTSENGHPAGRSFAEFKLIMRTGIDLDHLHPQISPLLQVMPWPIYQSMSDHDLLAIYEYLSAIPATPPAS